MHPWQLCLLNRLLEWMYSCTNICYCDYRTRRTTQAQESVRPDNTFLPLKLANFVNYKFMLEILSSVLNTCVSRDQGKKTIKVMFSDLSERFLPWFCFHFNGYRPSKLLRIELCKMILASCQPLKVKMQKKTEDPTLNVQPGRAYEYAHEDTTVNH